MSFLRILYIGGIISWVWIGYQIAEKLFGLNEPLLAMLSIFSIFSVILIMVKSLIDDDF